MQRFAETCEQIAATTRKLEKERILAAYLLSLDDEDLMIAARFFCGSPFALRDQRVLNTGFAVVREALLEWNPAWTERLGPALLRAGDVGEAVAALMAEGGPREAALRLREVRDYYDALAVASGVAERRDLTRSILERCTSLEAKYILKILLGGMRIGLQESLVESTLAKAFKAAPAEVQRANMLLGDIGECAVLARHGRLHQARMQLLHPIKPMLASPEENTGKILAYMDGEGCAEEKYDGIRAQVHRENDSIRIFSRDLDDITASFPDVTAGLSAVTGSFLMDGEIVPYRDGRILSFAELQTRLGRKELSPEVLASVPCRYFAFDLLFLNGETLFEQTLRHRRTLLESIHAQAPECFSLSLSRTVKTPEDIEAAFSDARAHNNEGLVIKHPSSEYAPGKRGKSWLKLKRAAVTLDVVVVAAEYGHGKRRGLLSDYTFAVRAGEQLATIGKAYSGITDEELSRLSEHFHRTSVRQSGHFHEVKPEVVLEVTFDRIQRSNRHSSGFALRFPRIKRVRWEKPAAEIDTLETVEEFFRQQSS